MTATNPYIPQPDDQHTSTQYGSPEQPQQAQQIYGQYQGQPYTDGGQTPPEQPAYGAPYTQQPYNAQYGASYNAPYTAPYTQGYYYGQSAQTDKWNGLCIAGFVCAFIIPPIGLILSIVALVQINKSHEKSKGMSIAGIAISALGTLFLVACIAFAVWVIGPKCGTTTASPSTTGRSASKTAPAWIRATCPMISACRSTLTNSPAPRRAIGSTPGRPRRDRLRSPWNSWTERTPASRMTWAHNRGIPTRHAETCILCHSE